MADRSYLDWPFFEPSHRALAAEAEGWAAGEGRRIGESGGSLDDTCRALVRSLGASGLGAHAVVAPHGGRYERLDVRSLCLIRETLARHSALADFAFAMQGLGSGPIVLAGSAAQKSRFLPPVARGEAIAAFALSEPQAGSDVAAIALAASPDGDDYVLSGRKTWISNGGIADQYVVFARTGEGPGTKGLSAFIVPAETDGLAVEHRIETIAPHPLATLRFADCRVPATLMLGAPGDGFRIAMATLDVFRSTVGAAALGLARRAFDAALDHSLARIIAGAALADYQMTQARIAEMATAIDAAALLVYRAAWVKDGGTDRVTREASMAKMFATEQAQTVIDRAVQIHGALGVTVGSTVEALYREIRALRIYEGATEVQKLVIARQALAAHRSEGAA